MVQQYHGDSFYWPSSPYYKEGEHASKNTPAGDIHYWGVWHEQHPFDDFYKYIGRFMSEYGFQSFQNGEPSLLTLFLKIGTLPQRLWLPTKGVV